MARKTTTSAKKRTARNKAATPRRSTPKRATRSPAAPAAPAAGHPTIPSTVSQKRQFLDTFGRETAKTLSVLRALPRGQHEIRPHELSRSARELAWTFVIEQILLQKAFTDQLTFTGSGGPPPAPDDFDVIVARFERDHRELVSLIERVPESDLHSTVQFPVGPGRMGDWSKIAFAWFILSDQIHHRGQFTVYLRMAGGKVPSIYGPSLDEPWR